MIHASHDVELVANATDVMDSLQYYVTKSDCGWMLVMRRGTYVSLTQEFESVTEAVEGAKTIAPQVSDSETIFG